MGVLSDLLQAVRERSESQKAHMQQQWVRVRAGLVAWWGCSCLCKGGRARNGLAESPATSAQCEPPCKPATLTFPWHPPNNNLPTLMMMQEKQAQRAQAKQPAPLTETQAAWQRFAAEQAAARTQQPTTAPALCRTAAEEPTKQEKKAQPLAAAARPVASTGFYTVTWKVRLTTLGQIPLPAWLESS